MGGFKEPPRVGPRGDGDERQTRNAGTHRRCRPLVEPMEVGDRGYRDHPAPPNEAVEERLLVSATIMHVMEVTDASFYREYFKLHTSRYC